MAIPEPGQTQCSHCRLFIRQPYYKCAFCDDYYLCSDCVRDAPTHHDPQHFYLIITKHFEEARKSIRFGVRPLRLEDSSTTHSAMCDGCGDEIRGLRYKCMVCPDFDYCASCWASESDAHGHIFARVHISGGGGYYMFTRLSDQ